MLMGDEDDRVPGPRVNLTYLMRSREGVPYELHLRQEGVEIYDLNQDIGWWAPGADCTLDKIEISGDPPSIYTCGDGWPKGSATAVCEGCEVRCYKTAMDDLESDDDSETHQE